jgi:hypothetical protein
MGGVVASLAAAAQVPDARVEMVLLCEGLLHKGISFTQSIP